MNPSHSKPQVWQAPGLKRLNTAQAAIANRIIAAVCDGESFVLQEGESGMSFKDTQHVIRTLELLGRIAADRYWLIERGHVR